MISLVSKSNLPGFITVLRCRHTDSSCSGLVASARQKLVIRSTLRVALISSKTLLTIGFVVFSSTSLTVGIGNLPDFLTYGPQTGKEYDLRPHFRAGFSPQVIVR